MSNTTQIIIDIQTVLQIKLQSLTESHIGRHLLP